MVSLAELVHLILVWFKHIDMIDWIWPISPLQSIRLTRSSPLCLNKIRIQAKLSTAFFVDKRAPFQLRENRPIDFTGFGPFDDFAYLLKWTSRRCQLLYVENGLTPLHSDGSHVNYNEQGWVKFQVKKIAFPQLWGTEKKTSSMQVAHFPVVLHRFAVIDDIRFA